MSDEELARCFAAVPESEQGRLLQELYNRHAGGLLGYLQRLTRCEHLAEDLTQETFIRVHRGLVSFGNRSGFKTWLFTIARNLFRDHLRGKQKMTAMEPAVQPEGPPTPDRVVEKKEALGRLRSAVDALPEELREPLVLVRLSEMSYAEAAGVMGITLPAVRMRVHRAHLALTKSLT